MQVDLQQASPGEILRSTVCIIGGGIAGLVLARRLAHHGIAVHVLEAGGLSLEDRSQDLYRAAMQSDLHLGTTEGRFRTFGGSSTRWGGQLLPFLPPMYFPRLPEPLPSPGLSASPIWSRSTLKFRKWSASTRSPSPLTCSPP